MQGIQPIKTVAVFCGSSEGNSSIYIEGALRFADVLIERNISLVYGGGGTGLMGLLSNRVYGKVPHVTGVIPNRLYESVKKCEHNEDELLIVDGMHERKALMYDKADAFIALPGGVGTLEEIMEAFTWLHLGYHDKPVGLFNIGNFYHHLIAFLTHCSTEGFLKEEFLQALIVDDDPRILMERMGTQRFKLPSKFE